MLLPRPLKGPPPSRGTGNQIKIRTYQQAISVIVYPFTLAVLILRDRAPRKVGGVAAAMAGSGHIERKSFVVGPKFSSFLFERHNRHCHHNSRLVMGGYRRNSIRRCRNPNQHLARRHRGLEASKQQGHLGSVLSHRLSKHRSAYRVEPHFHSCLLRRFSK